jgi:hypothetical protein
LDNGYCPSDLLNLSMVAVQQADQGFAKIAQQVEPIGHLHRLWGPGSGPFGVDAASVSGNDLGARMPRQPVGQIVGGSLREQIDHAVAFQVAQHRAVTLALTPGPVIHSQDRHNGRRLRRCPANQAEQCIAAGRHRQVAGQSSAR